MLMCTAWIVAGSLLIIYFNYHLFLKHTKRSFNTPLHSSTTTIITNETTNDVHCVHTLHHQPWTMSMLWGGTVPLLSLYVTLVISLCNNFESVTHNTGCSSRRVANIVPSVSACLGDFFPQRGIWRVCVMSYVWQRVISGFVQYFHYGQATRWTLPKVNFWRAIVHVVEQIFLIGLSAVSSNDHLLFHEISFGIFCTCSCLNMVFTDWLIREWKRQCALQKNEHQPLHIANRAHVWRWNTMIFNFGCLGFAVYFFFASQSSCIDYEFSKFATFEWLYVISNIVYQHSEQIELSYIDVAWVIMKKRV